MEFFKCSIGGVVYGTGTTEVQRAAALRTGGTPEPKVQTLEPSVLVGVSTIFLTSFLVVFIVFLLFFYFSLGISC